MFSDSEYICAHVPNATRCLNEAPLGAHRKGMTLAVPADRRAVLVSIEETKNGINEPASRARDCFRVSAAILQKGLEVVAPS
jgi:hypothetical protein